MLVKLYRIIDGDMVLVDYGIESKINTYKTCGYIPVKDYNRNRERVEPKVLRI